MSMNVIIDVLQRVDDISKTFIFEGYQQLAHALQPAIIALVGLSIVGLGLGSLIGAMTLSLLEVSKRIFVIGVVITLALNWGYFSSFVYALFNNIPNEISAHLVQSLQTSNTSSVHSALNQTFYQGMGYAKVLWEHGSVNNALLYVYALLMMLVVIAFIGFALFELIAAKFGLAVFLVLAPAVIPLSLFSTTKTLIVDGWLRHLVSFALIPIFVTSALALILMLFKNVDVQLIDAIHADRLTLVEVIPYVLYTFLGIGLVRSASAMASSMAGGIASSATPYADKALQWGRYSAMQSGGYVASRAKHVAHDAKKMYQTWRSS